MSNEADPFTPITPAQYVVAALAVADMAANSYRQGDGLLCEIQLGLANRMANDAYEVEYAA